VENAEKPTPSSTGAAYGNQVAELVPGQKVGGGRYTLIRFLGKGGMGIVWLARDERLGEQLALKLLPSQISGDQAALDDMRRETLKSRRLSHPNIIRIHDIFEAENEPCFISMEYVDGPNLSSLRLEQPQRLFSWEYVMPLVRQLCEALDYAHAEKVIHRDLKPANMMLDSRGRLKLADFGIAAVATDSMSRVSLKHQTSGTVVYMSPQQMNGQRPLPSDDIYAFGATLYELLSSRPPFYQGDIVHQVQDVEPRPLAERLAELELRNEIPPAVGAMVMACLSKDPEKRPPSMAAVAEWIGLPADRQPPGGILASQVGQAAAAAPASALVPSPEGDQAEEMRAPDEAVPEPKPGRRAGGWIVASVAAVLVLAAAAWPMRERLHARWVKFMTSEPEKGVAKAPEAASTPSPSAPARAKGPVKATRVPAQRTTNSLGMVFVPVPGTQVSFCVTHTRVQDFEVFVKATSRDMSGPMLSLKADGWKARGDNWRSPGFAQAPNHPVCGMSWYDATAFCKWLTAKEQREGKITDKQNYRLPRDWEWSVAVGLTEARGGSPADKSGKIPGAYPWGTRWPPPRGSGNYAGEEARNAEWPASNPSVIPGYRDGFPRTSPVGMFGPNEYRLYDMGGNLWQWCEDFYDGSHETHTLRGGSWLSGDARLLLSSTRSGNKPSLRDVVTGFRCVLAGTAEP
jgi:formylglycine-generating enzyme required for sulfatase activity